ncbi:MAG: type IV secretion system DNA-binding domain-containing protein, partial [Bacteroidota bacterium]
IGKTGTGKSNLIATMAISDIRAGNGIALIDPHGDLAETILHHIPKERVQDVVYVNPADMEYPIAFNPLGRVHRDFHHLVVSGLISIFKKIWIDFWGPRLEHILRHSLFTLLEIPGSTLIDLTRLLTEEDFRKRAVAQVTHAEVRAFWLNEFAKYPKPIRVEAVSPILNKMGPLLTSLPLRNIIGQPANSFYLSRVMDEKKILIVNLSKGKIGEDSSAFLGAMLTTMTYLAALTRSFVPENARTPFYLYVDEFHNFLTLSFADILSESRKYGLNLVLAHQYMNQLHENVIAAVLGNVGTIVSFRIGAEDAENLAREFKPTFDENDLVNLPNYNIYLKLMVQGVTSNPFSAATLALPQAELSQASAVIEQSRIKYTKPRIDVERHIAYRRNSEQQL